MKSISYEYSSFLVIFFFSSTYGIATPNDASSHLQRWTQPRANLYLTPTNEERRASIYRCGTCAHDRSRRRKQCCLVALPKRASSAGPSRGQAHARAPPTFSPTLNYQAGVQQSEGPALVRVHATHTHRQQLHPSASLLKVDSEVRLRCSSGASTMGTHDSTPPHPCAGSTPS